MRRDGAATRERVVEGEAAVQVVGGLSLGMAGLLAVVVLAGASLHMVATARRRLRRITALSDGIRSTLRAHGREEAVAELLDAVRRMLKADDAWLLLIPKGAAPPLRAERTDAGIRALSPTGLTAAERTLIERARTEGEVIRSGHSAPKELTAVLEARQLSRGMVVEVHGDAASMGLLAVGRRGGYRFGSDERDLLALVADHAGSILENDRLERSLREVTSLKEELRHRADHDSLTGLPNRALFTQRVAEAFDGRGTSGRFAVLFLDLDDFKDVNDTLGHEAGDALLVAVARRVAQAIRPVDLAARLGGDEFAVLVECLADDDGERVAERLVAALDAPFGIAGRELTAHASVGIAYGTPGHGSADDLLRGADLAMYDAKHAGKRRHASYEPAMQDRVRRRHELVTALERASGYGEIGVHYQPIVDLATGRLVAVEALARWTRPAVGLVEPAGFIPVADEVGLMSEIGRSVLIEACRQTRSWQRHFSSHARLGVAVNLAPSELHREGLVDEIEQVLTATGLDPDCLTLEITESGVMRSPELALETMTRLRALGVALSLDDFGTGHSSLAHLRAFPLDVLKIAQPFVTGLECGGREAAFIDTIVRLATALDLDVVCEGIESRSQADAALALACRLGQGFHFGRPLGPLGITEYLSADRLPARLSIVDAAA